MKNFTKEIAFIIFNDIFFPRNLNHLVRNIQEKTSI